jgi:hypothetical protein
MEDRISRRRMLKRVGAGAAVAWSAPVLSSLRTPAFASQAYPPAGRPCENCTDWTCGDVIQECGVPVEPGPCVCDQDVEGNCFCWNNFFCSDVSTCTTSADCPGTQRCVTSCCGTTCAPACGTPALSSTTSGPTGAGV